MRDLTQNEIDNAPEWATRYAIVANDICYVDDKYWIVLGTDGVSMKEKMLLDNPRSHEYTKPIPRKEFDITSYEFDDKFNIMILEVNDDSSVSLDVDTVDTYITKQDAIALAKHFKLTANDLNTQ